MEENQEKHHGDNPTNPTPPLSDKQEKLLEALFTSKGIVTKACQKAGVDRSTHYAWLKENEAYAEAYKSIEESAIDFVEGCMFERIEDGSDGLIKFYLATKGKGRGYIERTETEQINQLPPVVIATSADVDEFIKQLEEKEGKD